MSRSRGLGAFVAGCVCTIAAVGLLGPWNKPLSGQVGGGAGTVLEAPPIQLPAGVPSKVEVVLRYVEQNGKAPPGFVGGRVFTNDGRRGEQVLPRIDADGDPIEYHEWDVNRRVPGRNRGAERLVTGTDGSAYFTDDHYKTFKTIRGEAATEGTGLESARAQSSNLPPVVELPPSATAKVDSVLTYVRVHGRPMPGYVGGREYHNSGQGNGQVLPRVDGDGAAIHYQEWDVNPKSPGQNRGVERLITGSDGSAYYTSDHYKTFKRFQ
jgi:guanyl-specific ribonuclease Sa